MNRLTRWRRRRAARVLLDAFFEGIEPRFAEGGKTDDDLIIEAFLWDCHGAPEMAKILREAAEQSRRWFDANRGNVVLGSTRVSWPEVENPDDESPLVEDGEGELLVDWREINERTARRESP